MTNIFDELREIYTVWDETGRAFEHDANGFFVKFVRGFHNYIGEPPPYQDHPSGKPLSYVRIVVPNEGETGFEAPRNPFYLERDEDGFFNGYILLTLDQQPGRFPKLLLTFHAHFTVTPDEIVLDFGEPDGVHIFRLSPTDESSHVPAYEHMVSLVKKGLAHKPWEVSPVKEPIGFTLAKG